MTPMSSTGSKQPERRIPLWLLAELTYACPLQCPYCSNPVNYPETRQQELSSQEWVRVMREARELGAVQLGFSGGEPLVRQDLEELVTEARQLGFYTNLITSSVGMDAARVARLKAAGLDHIQVSFQGSDAQSSALMAGTDAFEHKLAMAREIKRQGYPMVLNFVLHRHNIDQVGELLELADSLKADFVELANTQYYGWALHNREQLLPSREQLQRAEAVTNEFRAQQTRPMQIFFVVPDYYEDRPKACSAAGAAPSLP